MKTKIVLFLFCFAVTGYGQTEQARPRQKKPTIMVVPSDAWCIKEGFYSEYDNLGVVQKFPNYRQALQESTDLLLVIGVMNDIMAERSFPLKNLESALKSLESEAAEDLMTMSKGGGSINESPLDKLKKVAKADIIMQITWTVKSMGPKKSITYNLQGLDSYSDKQIAGSSHTGQPSFSAEIETLLKESVTENMDEFISELILHFDDIQNNGREISFRLMTWDSWDYDLESEDFGDDELGFLIEEWMYDNTVNGSFSVRDATESMMIFEQVRIAAQDDRNRPQDARRWANNLRKYLRKNYQIESKLMTRGLGQAQLVLGEK